MYKKKTSVYGIPYLSSGESMKSSVEEKKAMILENLIFAANCGVSKVLFEDGDYDLFDNGDNTYTLTIMPETKYSVLGIVNYRLFKSTDTIVYEDLVKGRFYFIYAVYQEEMNIDASKFRKLATELSKSGSNHMLLATVDLTGSEPKIDEYPDGKEYSKEVLAHVTDHSNPHGRELHQDKLYIHDKLCINDHVVYEEIIHDGIFNSSKGVAFAIDKGKKAVFASVMPQSVDYGEYWVKIDTENVVVYNSGGAGGNFKICIKLEEE